MVEISFNKPGTKVFDQPLGIDKRKTLRELKSKIGKSLSIPADEIKICKNMISGEFKTLDASIDDCGIFDGCTVCILLFSSLSEQSHPPTLPHLSFSLFVSFFLVFF